MVSTLTWHTDNVVIHPLHSYTGYMVETESKIMLFWLLKTNSINLTVYKLIMFIFLKKSLLV